MKTTPSYSASIYVGQKYHYDGEITPLAKAREVLQNYCDSIGFCVTLTPTEYIYKNGNEPGFVVGLINYPRFPSDPPAIRLKAETVAKLLQKEFRQWKVSVVFPDETWMLEDDDLTESVHKTDEEQKTRA